MSVIAITVIIWFIIGFCLSIILIKNKLSRTIILIYNAWWVFWMILSTTNPLYLNNVSNSTYIVLIVNIISFYFGYILLIKKRSFYNYPKDIRFVNSSVYIGKLLLFLQFLIMLTLIYYSVKFNNIIVTIGATTNINVRDVKFSVGELFKTSIEATIYNIIVQSSVTISCIILPIRLLIKKRFDSLVIISIINILLYSFVGMGRMLFFELCVSFVFIFFILYYNGKKINLKKILILGILGLLAIVLLSIIAMSFRKKLSLYDFENIKGLVIDLSEQVIIYFIGSFRALDQFFNSNARTVQLSGATGIRTLFTGVDQLFCLSLRVFGINIVPINNVIGEYTQNIIVITKYGGLFNAFYTSVLHYYLAFGYIGIFVCPFIFGAIVAKSVNNLTRKMDICSIAICVELLYVSIATIFQWRLASPHIWIMLLITFIISKIRIYKPVLK